MIQDSCIPGLGLSPVVIGPANQGRLTRVMVHRSHDPHGYVSLVATSGPQYQLLTIAGYNVLDLCHLYIYIIQCCTSFVRRAGWGDDPTIDRAH